MAEYVDDELWEEFHRVVNMTARELREWLATDVAREASEPDPRHAAPPDGRRVLEILGKRRRDLDRTDGECMRAVVRHVHEARRDDLEPEPGHAAWRRDLMRVGHDPLKPPEESRSWPTDTG